MKVFNIVEKRVVIDENILLIPEFKTIVDEYKDEAINALCFIYYYCDYKSPFADFQPEQREERLMEMFNKKGTFTLEDQSILDAMKLYTDMQWTPTRELLDAVKIAMFKMADYLKNTSIIDGRDGNLIQIGNIMKNIGSTIGSYDELCEQVEKEQEKSIIRGGKKINSRER